MLRLYVLPIVGTGTSREDPRTAKYSSTHLNDTSWMLMDCGARPVCLVAADIDTTAHAALVAEPDVWAFPEGFEWGYSAVPGTAVRNAIRDGLESFGLPANWVVVGMTYRQIAHSLAALFQFVQRYSAMVGYADPFQGMTLATQLGDMADTGMMFRAAAESLGWSTAALTPTTTLRAALKIMADEWGDDEIHFGGFVL